MLTALLAALAAGVLSAGAPSRVREVLPAPPPVPATGLSPSM
ncbi:MAG: hypothetical protein JWO12_2570, partial [Frankiales bacterium]|nr:hypothetical protein [Frankiales bacterium]